MSTTATLKTPVENELLTKRKGKCLKSKYNGKTRGTNVLTRSQVARVCVSIKPKRCPVKRRETAVSTKKRHGCPYPYRRNAFGANLRLVREPRLSAMHKQSDVSNTRNALEEAGNNANPKVQ